MSRVGKQTIEIPAKTEVNLAGDVLTVKGPKGEISRPFKSVISIKIENNQITLTPNKKDLATTALWGTYASHIKNMIKGVTEGYTVKLVLEGIGYKADVSGNSLNMALGFSHPVKIEIPAGVTVASEKGILTFSSINKETVTQFAATIRSLKKPEPYKGKGFRYEDEKIKRKQGKKAA
ncbi:MAG: 50S ribosomal protein L6 [Candidatus Taylorbacteria bacterium]|nr:50S ribosomal protein L6 [Candidatus Taylorbacteria bacterium]